MRPLALAQQRSRAQRLLKMAQRLQLRIQLNMLALSFSALVTSSDMMLSRRDNQRQQEESSSSGFTRRGRAATRHNLEPRVVGDFSRAAAAKTCPATRFNTVQHGCIALFRLSFRFRLPLLAGWTMLTVRCHHARGRSLRASFRGQRCAISHQTL
jgi:hypothetical protein